MGLIDSLKRIKLKKIVATVKKAATDVGHVAAGAAQIAGSVYGASIGAGVGAQAGADAVTTGQPQVITVTSAPAPPGSVSDNNKLLIAGAVVAGIVVVAVVAGRKR